MGKKYQEKKQLVDKDKFYSLAEAVKLVKETSFTKFDATVETHFKLGVDPKKPDQRIRGTIMLPHGTGKTQRILVFAEGDEAKASEEAGADEVGADELIEKIQKGWLDFDVAIATPMMMKKVAKIAKVLGTKGLMPSPKAGTVSPDPAQTVKELKAGRIEYKLEKLPLIHAIVGKVSFTEAQLEENIRALAATILKAKPTAAKGVYFQGLSITSTMGPGIAVNVQELK